MSDKEKVIGKSFNELFSDSIDLKEDGSVFVTRALPDISFGKRPSSVEKWTLDKELNNRVTDELGYIPVSKQIERFMQAGEDLLYTKLADGTFSNEEGDEDFHDSFLDDISSKSYDELQNMFLATKENFFSKRAIIASAMRRAKSEDNRNGNLSTPPKAEPGEGTKNAESQAQPEG